MARGRGGGRFGGTLALFGAGALVTAYAMLAGWNPVPAALDALAKVGSLARPEPAWRVRVADQPTGAALTSGGVLVLMRAGIEARSSGSGDLLWHRDASWVAVAGAPGAEVAVVGRPHGRGYDVIDPATGVVHWTDPDALAAWTYRDAVFALRCTSGCVLVARDPRAGATRWSVAVPPGARDLTGGNPPLAAARPLVPPGAQRPLSPPVPAPPLLGLPVEGGVSVVDGASGARLGTYPGGPSARVVVAGRRVLRSTAVRRGGSCRFTVTATDPATGAENWRLDGYDLGSSGGAGCDQRRDPVGGGGVVAAVSPGDADVLLSVDTGRVVFVAGVHESMLATDGALVLVRTADRRAVRGVDLRAGTQRFRRALDRHAVPVITPLGVLVTEPGANLLTVLDAGGADRYRATTGAGVLGVGDSSLVINRGRTIGLLATG